MYVHYVLHYIHAKLANILKPIFFLNCVICNFSSTYFNPLFHFFPSSSKSFLRYYLNPFFLYLFLWFFLSLSSSPSFSLTLFFILTLFLIAIRILLSNIFFHPLISFLLLQKFSYIILICLLCIILILTILAIINIRNQNA